MDLKLLPRASIPLYNGNVNNSSSISSAYFINVRENFSLENYSFNGFYSPELFKKWHSFD